MMTRHVSIKSNTSEINFIAEPNVKIDGNVFHTIRIGYNGYLGAGLGIDKRTFGSCSYIYLVSRKNKRFFRKCPISWWSADYLRLVKDRPGGIFLWINEQIWVKMILTNSWVHFWPFFNPSTSVFWLFVKTIFSKIIYGAGWNLKSRF